MTITIGDSLKKSLLNRQARPLNGEEIKSAIESNLISMAENILNKNNIPQDKISLLIDELSQDIKQALSNQTRLRLNLSFPKIGWKSITRLEQLDNQAYLLTAEVELDLERNIRINIPIGQTGHGIVIASLEDEKIPSGIPDKDRETFNLPINIEHLNPDGTTAKTDLRDLRKDRVVARKAEVGGGSQKPLPPEKISARKVEVGAGVENPTMIQMTDPNDLTKTIEVPLGTATTGEKIDVITDDDILPTIPTPPMEPLTRPLPPPGGMNKKSSPGVKFKN